MFSVFDKNVHFNDDKFTDLFWMNSEEVFYIWNNLCLPKILQDIIFAFAIFTHSACPAFTGQTLVGDLNQTSQEW
jgi:hypothetical protein